MEKEKIYKLFISIYFLIVMCIGFWFLKDIFIKKQISPSKFEVLNTAVLDSSAKGLSKRNYIFNMDINSIDINNFIFGNPNPFR